MKMAFFLILLGTTCVRADSQSVGCVNEVALSTPGTSWIAEFHVSAYLEEEGALRRLAERLNLSPIQIVLELRALGIAAKIDPSDSSFARWSTVFERDGEALSELTLIAELFDEGFESEDIVRIVNHSPVLSTTADRKPCTVTPVNHLLQELGARQKEAPHSKVKVGRRGYGILREGSELNETGVAAFIIDHYEQRDHWIANALGITDDRLNLFFRQNSIRRDHEENHRFRFLRASDEAWDKRSKRRYIVDLILRWMKLHEETHPTAENFGANIDQVGVPYQRTVKVDFPSMEDLWIAVYHRARATGIRFRITRLKQVDNPEKLTLLWRQEAVDYVVDWMEMHEGRTPTNLEFGFETSQQIPLDFFRFTGTGTYNPNHVDKRPSAYFPSPAQAWLAVKRRARQRGIAASPFLGTHFQPSEEQDLIRLERADEARDRVLDWMVKYGRRPRDRDFGTDRGQVGIKSQPFFGTGNFREGKPGYPNRFHDTPEQAWRLTRERAVERNLLNLLSLFVQ